MHGCKVSTSSMTAPGSWVVSSSKGSHSNCSSSRISMVGQLCLTRKAAKKNKSSCLEGQCGIILVKNLRTDGRVVWKSNHKIRSKDFPKVNSKTSSLGKTTEYGSGAGSTTLSRKLRVANIGRWERCTRASTSKATLGQTTEHRFCQWHIYSGLIFCGQASPAAKEIRRCVIFGEYLENDSMAFCATRWLWNMRLRSTRDGKGRRSKDMLGSAYWQHNVRRFGRSGLVPVAFKKTTMDSQSSWEWKDSMCWMRRA